MKRQLGAAVGACMCMLALVLGACGNTSSSSTESTQTTEATESKAVSKDELVGTWKVAEIHDSGMVYVGDFSKYDYVSGNEYNVSEIVLHDNGEGTCSSTKSYKDPLAFTWTAKDDGSIEVQAKGTTDAGDDITLPAKLTYENKTLYAEDPSNSKIEKVGFTKDGRSVSYEILDGASATQVTKKEDLVGTWVPKVLQTKGLTIYGDIFTVYTVKDPKLVISSDGTVEYDNEKYTLTVDASGAVVRAENGNETSMAILDGMLAAGTKQATETNYVFFEKK